MNREEWAELNKKWTVEEFNDWKKAKAAELEEAQAQNQRAVDSAVIKSVTGLLKQGMTIDAAGDWLLKGDRIGSTVNGVIIIKEAALLSLRSIGWKSKDERKVGVEGSCKK